MGKSIFCAAFTSEEMANKYAKGTIPLTVLEYELNPHLEEIQQDEGYFSIRMRKGKVWDNFQTPLHFIVEGWTKVNVPEFNLRGDFCITVRAKNEKEAIEKAKELNSASRNSM